ncbi:MAG TPA: LPS-assembly protein LptD [Burkholderiales bacterium]|nr:LPS-assembly protein LptD [Burkholderiales bacterium]
MQQFPARELARRVAGCVVLMLSAAALAQTPEPGEPATIDAQSIEGISGLEVTATGSVEFRQGEFSVLADFLRFNREFGRLEARGGVRIQRGDDFFSGPSLRYDTATHTGSLEEPQFLMRRRLTARGAAKRVEFLSRDSYRLSDAYFTTCEPGHDDWRLEASELDLDFQDDQGTAHGARLRFLGAPILGSPYLTFPLNNRRRSGVLAPTISQSSQRGGEVSVPIYLNLAPEQDATLIPTYMTKRGEQLKAEYRYLGHRYVGQARVEYLPDDKQLGVSRTGYSIQHEQRFAPTVVGRLDVNHVSDDTYLIDLHSQIRQISTHNLQRDAYLDYAETVSGTALAAQARVQRFQTLQDPLAPIIPPYHRVPQIRLSAARNDMGGFLDGRLPMEYTRFTHSELVDGDRTTLDPVLAAPLIGPGYFFTTKLGAHQGRYNLNHTNPGQPAQQDVTVPWLSLDSGLVFERASDWGGAGARQTLEPRLFYVYAPYRNQSQLPLFDTFLADFNYAQLFSENRFVGGDRFGDANQLTWAITSRLLNAQGAEQLRATIGQRYYFQAEQVGLTADSELRTANESDWLAAAGGRFGRAWLADAAFQYNPNTGRSERYGVQVRYSPEIAKVINFDYRFNRNVLLRQVDLSAQWPLGRGWYGVGRYNYSLQDEQVLEALGGFEYNGGCWVFRAVYQRVQAATDVVSKGIFFQLEFSGFGQLGSNDVVNLFRRNVPGYSVTNPKDQTLVPPGLGVGAPGAEGR